MSKRQNDPTMWRFRVLAISIGLMSLVLVARLGYIQIGEHDIYAQKAEDQYGSVRTIPATRGSIKSSDGADLATTEPVYLVSADPSQIHKDGSIHDVAVKIANALYAPLPTDELIPQASDSAMVASPSAKPQPTPTMDDRIKDLESKLDDPQRLWVELARKVDEPHAQRLRDTHIVAIHLEPEQKRYYPEGTLASQVLGFVGSDSQGNDQGYYGIEGYFDQDLRGRDGKVYLEKDRDGDPIPVGKYQPVPVEQGATITLTINRSLQYMLEQKLKAGVEKNKADGGSVILMEPSTGRILAMANYPTYDPNHWSDPAVQKQALFKNSAISDVYEPGSVMKTFTVATGIDLGLFGPDTTYTSAPYTVDGHTIHTADDHYYGTATVTEMLEHSDNTGAAQFGLKIGRDRFLASLRRLGLDRPTGITLEGEGRSIIPDTDKWIPLTLATASFGQGISVTPMELIEMMATVANHGEEMKPTIIQSVTKDGQTKVVQPESEGQIFSRETSAKVNAMLEQVVEHGEFHRLALHGYHIAGKTGTAQIPENGVYDPNKTITTFVGFAPSQNPAFIMLVKLNKPAINNSAETVVPVWMDMAKSLFQYFGMAVEPTPTPTPTP